MFRGFRGFRGVRVGLGLGKVKGLRSSSALRPVKAQAGFGFRA